MQQGTKLNHTTSFPLLAQYTIINACMHACMHAGGSYIFFYGIGLPFSLSLSCDNTLLTSQLVICG
jgi:hypothetical protein